MRESLIAAALPEASGAGVTVYQAMSEVARRTGAVNLAQGIPEPVLDSQWAAAVTRALGESWQYTPTRGLARLREAISAAYGLEGTDGCLVTCGCTEALLAALKALSGAGLASVVALEPFYSYYPGLARLAGASFAGVRLLQRPDAFAIDWPAIEEHLARGGRVLLLNSPHNPTGFVLSEADWGRAGSLCRRHAAAMLVDDVYRDFCYGCATPLPGDFSGLRMLWAGSVSKSLAASGVRVGWLLGDAELVEAAHHVHMHASNCQPGVLQAATVHVLAQVGAAERRAINHRYLRRRDLLAEALRQSGFSCRVPAGGHFIVADLGGSPGMPLLDYCVRLAETVGVAALPLDGFFGARPPAWIRFSFSVGDDAMALACERLAGFHLQP